MESTTKGTQDIGKTTGGAESATQPKARTTTTSPGGATTATQPVREREAELNRGEGMVGQAKQAVSGAYDQTSKALNETYKQAVDYGREHPGQTVLIAFGVGIGVGILLAGGLTARSRTSRIVPPVMNAINEIVSDIFR